MSKRVFDARLESMSQPEIRDLQLQKLRHMLVHVSQTNDFYQRMWKQAGVDVESIRSIEDFAAAVPMVEKKDFVADQKEYPPFGSRFRHPMSLKERLDVFTTSGTSGQGVEIHAQTKRELAAMEHMYGFYFRWAGLEPGDSLLLTLPITMMAGGRIEYQGAIGNDLTVYPAGNVDAKQKLELLERFQPKALYGSTSYFGHLGSLSGKSPPCPSVKVLLTGLEGAGLSFLKRLEEQWQAKAADRFGCSQMRADFMFTDEQGVGEPGKPGILYNIDPYVLLEVIDTTTGLPVNDGEFGEMVVTSLYHFDNPVIRNRLRDGGIFRRGGAPGARRNFGGIEVASIARTDDVKKVKGVNLFPQAVDDLLFSLADVEEYQVVLTSSSSMSDIATVQIMTKSALDPRAAAAFRKTASDRLRERMGISFEVELVGDLPRSEYKARRWRDERQR